ncbi:hypothetical protein GOBAR_DD12956 [Gossypium barbadense]|nr:hypothetical protein GOBAR_DD12956 [Gossypium barbadense]
MEAAKEDFGTAPMMHSSPFLKNMMIGMLLIPNCVALFGLSSVLSLLREIFPAYSLANSAITGSIIQQGPHHDCKYLLGKGYACCNNDAKSNEKKQLHIPAIASLSLQMSLDFWGLPVNECEKGEDDLNDKLGLLGPLNVGKWTFSREEK